jgi:hypothetical protein
LAAFRAGATALGKQAAATVKTFFEFHGLDLGKNLALGIGTGAIAGTASEAMSMFHYYTDHPEVTAGPGEIFSRIGIGMAAGAAAGVVGAGAGFAADLLMSKALLTLWRGGRSKLSESLVRGFGVGRGFISGGVSGLIAQYTSNAIAAARGQVVNSGLSLGLATAAGAIFGGPAGRVGATRMRVWGSWLKATTAKGVTPRIYKATRDKGGEQYEPTAPGRNWHYYARTETIGQQWGAAVSAGAGLLGGVGAAALTEWL